jgi:hypothetical protein
MLTKTFTRFSVPAALVAAALALSGCSSAEVTKSATEEGPLQKYMSALYDDEQYSQEYADKQNAKTEDLVAKCMAKEGFEYTPNTQNGGMVYTSTDDETMEMWGTLEFAETYGYGIVDDPFMRGPMAGGEEGSEEQWVDPNQEYLDSLSESEQNAYYETLNGTAQSSEEVIEAGEASDWDPKVVGCSAAAQHETESEDAYSAASEDPEFTDLFVKMQEVYSAMYGEDGKPSNDALIKLDRDWSACMAKDGYDFENPMSANNFMQEEWYGEQGNEPEEPSKEDKKKFQEQEIRTAVADWKCQDKVDYVGTQQRMTNELEQKFVDEYKVQLDAMLARYGTKKKDK